MADEEETVYVVAPGVTVYDDDNVFPEGTEITPEDLGDLNAFRALMAAGKIVVSTGGGEPPPADDDWNYTDIDTELNPYSPNPVENRTLYARFKGLDDADKELAAQVAVLTEAMAVPIPAQDIRDIYEGAMNNGEEVS